MDGLLCTLAEGEALSFYWHPVVLLHTGPAEMHSTWNGTCSTERWEKVRVLVWHLLPVLPPQANMEGLHNWVRLLTLQPH